MAHETFQIAGRIIDRASQLGIPGLRIEVWDNDSILPGQIDETFTDAKGRFQIELDVADFDRLFPDRKPALFVKIYHSGNEIHSTQGKLVWGTTDSDSPVTISIDWPAGSRRLASGYVRTTDERINNMNPQHRVISIGAQGSQVKHTHTQLVELGFDVPETEQGSEYFGKGTQNAIRAFQEEFKIPVNGVIDRRTAEALHQSAERVRERYVQVRVLWSDGAPAQHVALELHHMLVDDEVTIVRSQTDDSGSGTFTYKAEPLDLDPASLALRVVVLDEHEEVLASSPVLFHPDASESVTLELWRPPSSPFERARTALAPLLGRTRLEELSTSQITHLANISDFDHSELTALVNSARTAATLDIPETMVYLLQRGGINPSAEALLGMNSEALINVVNTARSENRIDDNTANVFRATIQGQLRNRQVAALLDRAAPNQAPTLRDLIDTLPDKHRLDEAVLTKFGHALVEKGEDAPDLWERAEMQYALRKSEIDTLKIMYALRDLTDTHLALMVDLQERRSDDGDSLAYLAHISSKEWALLGLRHGSPPGSNVTIGEYVDQLRTAVETKFPSQVLSERLRAGEISGEILPIDAVVHFLQNHSDFDIRAMPIERYLLENELPSDQQLTNSLQAIQRLYAITPRFDEMKSLLNSGLDSAARIVQLGKEGFARYVANSLNTQQATALFAQAHEVNAVSIGLATRYAPLYNTTGLAVLPALTDQGASDKFPSLSTLFGSIAYCECRHCRSVFSPAAYFVDLLQFLNKPPTNGGSTALNVLLSRRPDLAHLHLTCENTNTEIPYIDLVLELLENAVGLPVDVQIQPGVDVEADLLTQPVPQWIIDQLAVTTTTVGRSLVIQKSPNSGSPIVYSASDGARTWGLHYWPWQFLQYDPSESTQSTQPAISGVNVQDVVVALNHGSLDQNLQSQLMPPAQVPLVGPPTITKTSNNNWIVEYIRGINLQYHTNIQNPTQGNLQVTAPDGTSVGDPIPLDQFHWRQIEAKLQSWQDGAIPDLLLRQAFDLSSDRYVATFDERSSQWIIRCTRKIHYSYTPQRLKIASLTFQSSSLREDLLASSENRNLAAYKRLRLPNFPWSLPFDLWTEEIRAFLDNLGVTLRQLIDAARPARRWTGPRAALEQLGLNKAEAAIISTTALPTSPWLHWGLKSDGNSIFDHEAGQTRQGTWLSILKTVSMLLQQSGLSMSSLLDVMQTRFVRVAAPTIDIPLLECRPSEITLDTLTPAHLHAIHRLVRLWRRLGWPIHELDFAIYALGPQLNNNTLIGLSLIHRLRERLHLPIQILAMWASTFDTHPISRAGEPEMPSPYAAIFLKPLLHSPPDADFTLDASGTQLVGAAKTLSEKRNLIAAALGVTPAEIEQLLDVTAEQAIPDELKLDNLASLYGVVTLCQALSLSIADYLRVCLILNLAPLARNNVPTPPLERLRVLLQFVQHVDFMRGSGFTFEEVDYLLRHGMRPGSQFANLPTQLEHLLGELRTGLRSIHNDVMMQVDGIGLTAQLAKLGWPVELINMVRELVEYRFEVTVEIPPRLRSITIPDQLRDRFFYREKPNKPTTRQLGCLGLVTDADFATLSGTLSRAAVKKLKDAYFADRLSRIEMLSRLTQSFKLPVTSAALAPAQAPEIPAEFRSRLYYAAREQTLNLVGWLTAAERDLLKALSADAAYQLAVDDLYDGSNNYVEPDSNNTFLKKPEVTDLLTQAPPLETRVLFILKRLDKRFECDWVTTRLAEALYVERAAMESVLRYMVDPGTNTRAFDMLTDAAFVQSDPRSSLTTQQFQRLFALLMRLHKTAILLAHVKANSEDVAWLVSRVFNTPDLALLPVDTNSAVPFDSWRRFVQIFWLRDALPDGRRCVTNISAAKDIDTIQQILADAFELTGPTVTDACAADLLDMTRLQDFRAPRRLVELVQFLHLLKMLGTTPAVVKSLIANQPTVGAAQAARQLFKAHFGPDTWAERLKPVSDLLRERQRDALVDFQVYRNGLRDKDSLYDYFLIDVQMGSCMVTSRIRQAISAVQLFVQYVLLNLEEDVLPDAIDTQIWAWMKNYRVWEANRKVFLFPENWIEPELRDDKSEIFQALESDLLQSDLTHEKAVEALRRYLDKLNDISHLTNVAIFEEETAQGGRTVHIVGRTEEQPYRHFYRQWVLSEKLTGYFTPWEEITLSINSDHVMLFDLNGVIHIAWAVITATSEAAKIATGAPESCWQVQLQWGKRTSEGWTGLKKSRETLQSTILWNKDERTSFAFTVGHSNDDVIIRCYGARDSEVTPLLPTNDEIAYVSNSSFPFSASTNIAKVKVCVLGKWQDPIGPPRYVHIDDANIEIKTQFFFWNSPNDHPWDIDDTPIIGFTDAQGEYEAIINLTLGATGIFLIGSGTWTNLQLKISVTIDSSISSTTIPPKVFRFPQFFSPTTGYYYFGLDLYAEFVVDLNTEPIDPASMPDRKVEMFGIGNFRFGPYGDVKVSQGSSGFLRTFDDCEYYESGLRERPGRPDDAFDILNTNVQQQPSWSNTPGRYFLIPANTQSTSISTWAYKDKINRMYILRSNASQGVRLLADGHDYIPEIRRKAYVEGIESALATAQQLRRQTSSLVLQGTFDPLSYSDRAIDFDLNRPYSGYNWEIFFHIPLLIATQLSKSQRFAEAQRWFHLIFDPTTNEDRQEHDRRFWRFERFRHEVGSAPIDVLLEMLARPGQQSAEETRLIEEIDYWKTYPFRPHAIARMRVRAYMVTTVMKYLENLIAWGDQLFRSDRPELVEESIRYYVLAARLLGSTPQVTPQSSDSLPVSYAMLSDKLDPFSNAWLGFENLAAALAPMFQRLSTHGIVGPSQNTELEEALQQLASMGSLFFCVPNNDKLLDYWSTVEDRLFKLRHCMNIDGIERRLPLFEPPIDPALLVRATAAGLALPDVLASINAPLPHYRFNMLIQKAAELSAELKSMGAALLGALEKQDAEALALLRSTHEIEMQKRVGEVRQQQIDEADANLRALETTRRNVFERYRHYQRILGKSDIIYPAKDAIVPSDALSLRLAPDASLGLLHGEQDQLALLSDANTFAVISGFFSTLASVLHLMPNFNVSMFNTSIETGGSHAGLATGAVGSLFNALATNASYHANVSSILSGYQRRQHDWVLQSNLAAKEIEQIDKQIIAAEIRCAIAQHELENHEQQLANTQEVDAFMREKYTNQQLYQWMVGQISAVYFRAYQLAYDVAKRAERTYCYELGLQESNMIQYGYWDSLKKGLMAGEHLYHDIKRMDIAYLEQNQREYEITQHFSLAMHAPGALIALKATGRCVFEIDETLLDLDYAGHYLRRIKSVAVTIPSVTGPYASLNCRLTLGRSSIRHSKLLPDGKYARNDPDTRFTDVDGAYQSIVTSSGTNDSGLFETNLRDERYLPFEGLGAISSWQIDIPRPGDFPAFDYNTITDVILHVRYTAREGGDSLQQAAISAVRDSIEGARQNKLARLFSLSHEFSNEWSRFVHTAEANGDHVQILRLSKERFPYLFRGNTITVTQVEVYGVPKENEQPRSIAVMELVQPPPDSQIIELAGGLALGAVLCARSANDLEITVNKPKNEQELVADWTLRIYAKDAALLDELNDILLVCHYEVS